MLRDATLSSFDDTKKSTSKKVSKKSNKKETSKKANKKETSKKSNKKETSKKKVLSNTAGVSNLDKDFESNATKLLAQCDKVSEAIVRYTSSQNKKNTAFTKNNLKKLIELANKLDEKIGE